MPTDPNIKKKPAKPGIGPTKLPEKFPNSGPIGAHPKNLPESLVERKIKELGGKHGSMITPDLPYLEQYLHPEYDVLERQSLRPTIRGGGTDDLEWYRPDIQNNWDDAKELDLRGLGNFTYSDKNPKYDSFYDKWDFDTESPLVRNPLTNLFDLPNTMAKTALQHLGKPFHVYERVPKDSYGTVQEGTEIQPFSSRGRDINLPSPNFPKPKPKSTEGIGPSAGKMGGLFGDEIAKEIGDYQQSQQKKKKR